jgi:hypothetical protein
VVDFLPSKFETLALKLALIGYNPPKRLTPQNKKQEVEIPGSPI